MPNWLHNALNSKFAFGIRKMMPVWMMKRICHYKVTVNYSNEQYQLMYDWVKNEMTYFSSHTVINRVIERFPGTTPPYQVRVTSIEFYFRKKVDAAMFKLMFADMLDTV
jgi:hypothetical protein